MEIRGMSISHASFRKREKDSFEKNLIEDIQKAEMNQNSTMDFDILKEKKNNLENIRKQKLQGHIIRSKAKWVEEGEKPTRYFCNLESRNYLNKTIQKLDIEGKGIVHSQPEILNEIKHFYQELYSSGENEINDLDLNLLFHQVETSIPRLDAETADKLEGEMTETEILAVLRSMKDNKSPGSDGFTADFFKFFWIDLKCFIVRAVNDVFTQKSLPVSQRLGIITCLPKGDKPRQHLKNWRPITLLNVFYKLISGCLSHRIKSTLDVVISNTQTGFMSGRYIGENTRLIYDIMSYTEENNIPGLLVFIDFEKAFDSIAWSFIYKTLHFFGYKENFIEWIKILNTDFKASVLQSGFLSEQISVKRGCRQGDPVSPYLFLLCAEILAILIKSNKDIKGLIFNNEEFKVIQYADDTSLTLDGSEKSLYAALDTLDFFYSLSGLRMNASKTKVIWIGSKKFSKEVYHHSRWKLEWGSTRFNLLGIAFSVDLEEMVNLNYETQILKIRASIKQWSRRILTPIGRVTVVKTLLLPMLNHLFITLPNPTTTRISSLSAEFFRFIWGSKCDKIRRKTIIQKNELGGLKMINLDHFMISMKCSWIKRILKSDQSWMSLFETNYGGMSVQSLLDFGDDYVTVLINSTRNKFWIDTFKAWQRVMRHQIKPRETPVNLYTIPIWYNSVFKVNNKSLFIRPWYEKGVKIIGDFLDKSGNILTKSEFEQKYNMTNICFMQYNSIYSMIRKFLKSVNFDKENFTEATLPFIPFYFKFFFSVEKPSKLIYDCLNVNYNMSNPTAIEKWNMELYLNFPHQIIVQDVFKNCFKTSRNSSIQWLQFRILHRIVPVGTYLKKIKVKDNDTCTFCSEEIESIQHTFFLCPVIYTLWTNLADFLFNKTGDQIIFNLRNVLFGEKPSFDNLFSNLIILYTKAFIFSNLMRKAKPSLKNLLNYLRFHSRVEKYIAIKNYETQKNEDMWNKWKKLFMESEND